jgi:hypothetical protein
MYSSFFPLIEIAKKPLPYPEEALGLLVLLLSARDYQSLQELAPSSNKSLGLPGIIGPVPPPLWIRDSNI